MKHKLMMATVFTMTLGYLIAPNVPYLLAQAIVAQFSAPITLTEPISLTGDFSPGIIEVNGQWTRDYTVTNNGTTDVTVVVAGQLSMPGAVGPPESVGYTLGTTHPADFVIPGGQSVVVSFMVTAENDALPMEFFLDVTPFRP